MKNYRITVNGTAYDVAVEEVSAGMAQAAPIYVPQAAPAAIAQAAPAPAIEAAPTAPAPQASGSAGSITLVAPMPGKILAVKSKVGEEVKRGEVVLILEAMKMENEVVASEDGVIASIDVSVGQMVESGDVLATMN